MDRKKPTGTREWSCETLDIADGCPHNCAYCYSKTRECYRFKRISPDDWEHIKLRAKAPKYWKSPRHGQLMFPANHDIVPEILDECITALLKAVDSWESVLIVTKPHLLCVTKLCDALKGHKNKVLFRFTIGSYNNDTLKFWEPGAPNFKERLASLKWAHGHGFKTSVSSEPTLDRYIGNLIELLLPFITDALWVGPMNVMETRVRFRGINYRESIARSSMGKKGWTDREWAYFNVARSVRDPIFLKLLYARYKDNPHIKWKNESKKILGLPLADEIGLDV